MIFFSLRYEKKRGQIALPLIIRLPVLPWDSFQILILEVSYEEIYNKQ
jgi:hypothetical protein